MFTKGALQEVSEDSECPQGAVRAAPLLQFFGSKHSLLSKSTLICSLPKTLNLTPPELMRKSGLNPLHSDV